MKLNKHLSLFIAAILSSAAALAAEPMMSGNTVLGEQGGDAMLEVKLTNTSPLRDFQLNLSLPDGISIKADSKDNYLIDVNKEVAPYHAGIANYDEGIYKIVVTAAQDAPILSDGKVLFSVPLVLDAPIGNYVYEFSSVFASQDIDGLVTNVPFSDFGGIIIVEAPVALGDVQIYSKKMLVDEGATQAKLAVSLKNNEAVKAFNFDIEFPEGIEPVYNAESDDYVEFSDRIPSRFDVIGELNGNVLNVDGATTRNTSVAAGNDVLVYIDLSLKLAAGTYPLKYVHQTVTLVDGTVMDLPDYTGYIVVGDGMSGISIISIDEANGRCYDIMGRPVLNPKRGVYIIDGKKTYVK